MKFLAILFLGKENSLGNFFQLISLYFENQDLERLMKPLVFYCQIRGSQRMGDATGSYCRKYVPSHRSVFCQVTLQTHIHHNTSFCCNSNSFPDVYLELLTLFIM